MRESGLPWVPVFDPIRTLPEPESFYIPGDGHLNELGNKLIPTLIFNRLVCDGYLKGPEVDWDPPVPASGDR